MPCSNSGGGVQKKIWKQLQPSDSVEDLRLLIQLNLKHPLFAKKVDREPDRFRNGATT
jgi:hypothetical protein